MRKEKTGGSQTDRHCGTQMSRGLGGSPSHPKCPLTKSPHCAHPPVVKKNETGGILGAWSHICHVCTRRWRVCAVGVADRLLPLGGCLGSGDPEACRHGLHLHLSGSPGSLPQGPLRPGLASWLRGHLGGSPTTFWRVHTPSSYDHLQSVFRARGPHTSLPPGHPSGLLACHPQEKSPGLVQPGPLSPLTKCAGLAIGGLLPEGH